jgi:hypothetical protein
MSSTDSGSLGVVRTWPCPPETAAWRVVDVHSSQHSGAMCSKLCMRSTSAATLVVKMDASAEEGELPVLLPLTPPSAPEAAAPPPAPPPRQASRRRERIARAWSPQ